MEIFKEEKTKNRFEILIYFCKFRFVIILFFGFLQHISEKKKTKNRFEKKKEGKSREEMRRGKKRKVDEGMSREEVRRKEYGKERKS